MWPPWSGKSSDTWRSAWGKPLVSILGQIIALRLAGREAESQLAVVEPGDWCGLVGEGGGVIDERAIVIGIGRRESWTRLVVGVGLARRRCRMVEVRVVA
jgi:hypothetical protein